MIIENKRFGIGISGIGVGERHARMINKLDGFSLLKIYDPLFEKAKKLSFELNSKACKSYYDLVSDDEIEIIIIASPDHFHAEQIIDAFKAGKHVFVEKPLCNTYEELITISNEWQRHNGNLKLFSNLILREAPLYKWLKKSIKEGEFGEIYSVDGDYLYGRKEKIINGWRGTAINYSGMKGGGIHMVDLMCWLTDQKPKSVTTLGNNISTRNSGITVTDYMSTSFNFESGMVGKITSNLGCVHRHQHVLRVFGTKATFIFDDKGPRIHFSSDPSHKVSEIELDGLPEGKSDLIPIFLKAVKNNIDLRSITKDTFNLICILDASDKALISGELENIQYL